VLLVCGNPPLDHDRDGLRELAIHFRFRETLPPASQPGTNKKIFTQPLIPSCSSSLPNDEKKQDLSL
jgi:hypothetical protein